MIDEKKDIEALLSLMKPVEKQNLVDQYAVHYFLSNEANRSIYYPNLSMQIYVLRVSESKFIPHIYSSSPKKESNLKLIKDILTSGGIKFHEIYSIKADNQNYSKENDYFIFHNFPFSNKNLLRDILNKFNYIIFYSTNADEVLENLMKDITISIDKKIENLIESINETKNNNDTLLLDYSNKIFDKIDLEKNYACKVFKYRMYQNTNIHEIFEKEILINFKNFRNVNIIVFLDFTGVYGKVILNPLPYFMKNVKRVIYDNDSSKWKFSLSEMKKYIYTEVVSKRANNDYMEAITNIIIIKNPTIYIDTLLKEQIQCGKYPHITPELSDKLDKIIKSDKVNFPEEIQIYSLTYLFYYLQCNRLIIYKHGQIPFKPEIQIVQTKPQKKKKSEIVPLIKIALSVLKGTEFDYPFDKENLHNLQSDFWLFLEMLKFKVVNKQKFIYQIQNSISENKIDLFGFVDNLIKPRTLLFSVNGEQQFIHTEKLTFPKTGFEKSFLFKNVITAMNSETRRDPNSITFFKRFFGNKQSIKYICHEMKKLYSFGENNDTIEIIDLRTDLYKYDLSARNIKNIDDDAFVALDVKNDWTFNPKQIDVCLMSENEYCNIGKKNSNKLQSNSQEPSVDHASNSSYYTPNSYHPYNSSYYTPNSFSQYNFMIPDLPIQVQEHFKNEIIYYIKNEYSYDDDINYQNGKWSVPKKNNYIKEILRDIIPNFIDLYMSLDQFNVPHDVIKLKFFDHVIIEGNFAFIQNKDQKFMSDEDKEAFFKQGVDQNTQFFKYKPIDLDGNILEGNFDAFKMRKILEEKKELKNLPKKLKEMGIKVDILEFFYWMLSCDETRYVAENILRNLNKLL